MDFIRALTPQDTEEIRPGLFIQYKNGKYRQIYPAAWNGKIIWKNLITGGPGFWKTLIWFIIILLIIFSYWHDVHSLREFHQKVTTYKNEWCVGVPFNELGKYKVSGGGVLNATESSTTVVSNNIG